MATGQASTLLQYLHGFAARGSPPALSDHALLQRFAAGHDQDAFAALVRRHGPLVFSVCRRVLRQAQDAEDAFQATFLVLARKAGSLRWRESVANWLYGVAYRLALKAKAAASRRAAHESRASAPRPDDPLAEITLREAHTLLDEQLARLPEKYRIPLVLCYLGGATRDEAAQRLGWSLGTLKRRLEQGRQALASRLARRGLTLSGALTATVLASRALAAPPPVPSSLLASTVKAATSFVTGSAESVAATPAVDLAKGVLTIMSPLARLKAVAPLLVICLAVGVSSLLAQQGQPAGQPEPKPAGNPPPLAGGPASGLHLKDRHGDPLPPAALLRLGTVRWHQGGDIYSAAHSPDGTRLVTSGGDGTIRVWDAATGKELRRIAGHSNIILAVAFSPDGKKLASGGFDKTVRVWDAGTGHELLRMTGHKEVPRWLAFTPDGKTLATACDSGTVHLWNVVTGEEVRQLKGHKERVWSAALSADGRFLASGSLDKTIRVWDLTTGEAVGQFRGHDGEVISVAFSPDGKVLASAGDNTVRLWETATGKELQKSDVSCALSVRFSPDGKTLAMGIAYDSIQVRDVATGKALWSLKETGGCIGYLAFAPDGKSLVSWGDGNTLRFWDAGTGKEVSPSDGHRHDVRSLAISPDGKVAATAGGWPDNTVRLWDVASGRELHRLNASNSGPVSFAFSPDGKVLFKADGGLRLWEVATGKELPSFIKDPDAVEALALSPDGKTLATVGGDGQTVALWDGATGKKLERRLGPVTPVACLAFSPDGRTVVTGHGDGTLRLWDATTAKERTTIPDAGVNQLGASVAVDIAAVAFSPDGKLLATLHGKDLVSSAGGYDIRLWDAVSGREAGRIRSERGVVKAFAFSPDGRTLAGGAADGTVQLWEVATRTRRGELAGHANSTVRSLTFSGDGRKLLSGGDDGTALIWDLTASAEGIDPGTAPVEESALETLWGDLGSTDAVKAYSAVGRLTRAPDQAVTLAKKHLRPARGADAEEVARLLTDLDSDKFAVREKATRRLEELGEAAAPQLRKELDRPPSAEVRGRVEKLLERLEGWSSERLRMVRLIEVLERVGTPEAQKVVEPLARGLSGAWLTEEAKASLTRLERKRSW